MARSAALDDVAVLRIGASTPASEAMRAAPRVLGNGSLDVDDPHSCARPTRRLKKCQNTELHM